MMAMTEMPAGGGVKGGGRRMKAMCTGREEGKEESPLPSQKQRGGGGEVKIIWPASKCWRFLSSANLLVFGRPCVRRPRHTSRLNHASRGSHDECVGGAAGRWLVQLPRAGFRPRKLKTAPRQRIPQTHAVQYTARGRILAAC